MGKINLQKVVFGGLIAGVVLNVIDFVVFNMILKNQMTAMMAALGKSPPAGGQIAWFVILDFVVGIFLVWLYAAVRPRMGAGPATAAKAGVAAWFLGNAIATAVMWPKGLMPHNFLVTTAAIAQDEGPPAEEVSAKIDTQAAAVGARRGQRSG